MVGGKAVFVPMRSEHPESTELPVLIVGAGPVGLCLAMDLARRGIH